MSQPDYTNMRKIVTGDVIVKCRYGDDIRRIAINQAPSFDELCLMMVRVFKLPNTEDITLKYTDNENDLISLLDDNDITQALSQSNLLKVTVSDKKNIRSNGLTAGSVITDDLKNQLSSLRDTLDAILRSVPEKNDEKPQTQSVDPKYRPLSNAELALFLDNTLGSKTDGTPKESAESLTPTNTNINKPQSTPTIKNNNTFLPPGTPKQTPMKSPGQPLHQTSPYAQRPPLSYPTFGGGNPQQHSPSAPGTPHNVYQSTPSPNNANNMNKFNGPPPNFMGARPPVPPMQQNQRPPPNGFQVPGTPSMNQQQLPQQQQGQPPQQQQFRPPPPQQQQQQLPPSSQGPPPTQGPLPQQGPPPQQGQPPLQQQPQQPLQQQPPSSQQGPPPQQQQAPFYYSMPGTNPNNQPPPQTPQQNFRPPPSGPTTWAQ